MILKIKPKGLRVLVLTVGIIISLLILLLMVAFIGGWASQRDTYTKPFENTEGGIQEGSIAEYKRLKIGGVTQALLIRGRSVNKPVLLFIHGGPGSGIIGQAKANAILEDYFTVVYWDQYGASKSYTPFLKKSHLTLNQFISDGHEVTQYVKGLLGKDKIVILGHSWGSILGAYLAQKYPNDYHAFIGMGQVVNFRENLKGSYEYALSEAKKAKNNPAVAELEAIEGFWGLTDTESLFSKVAVSSKWLIYYGGYFHGKYDLSRWFKEPFNDEFTVFDAMPWLLGQSTSVYTMFPELLQKVDLALQVPELKIPYYLFMGKSDYNTPWYMAEQYFNRLIAPEKTIVWFNESGHEPNTEEAGKFNKTMINTVLKDIPTEK